MNRKRIERLWRLEGLRVPPRRRKRLGNESPGVAANAAWNRPAIGSEPRVVLRLHDHPTRRRTGLRLLNVVDGFTREGVGFHVARNIGTREVQRQLATMFRAAARGRR